MSRSYIDPSYDEDFPYPHLDPPELGMVVVKAKEGELHWDQQHKLGYKPNVFALREYGDNSKQDPEQNWDEENEL